MNWYKTAEDMTENKENKEDIICPFCKETGFDLMGLKNHLEKYCEVYSKIDISSIVSVFR